MILWKVQTKLENGENYVSGFYCIGDHDRELGGDELNYSPNIEDLRDENGKLLYVLENNTLVAMQQTLTPQETLDKNKKIKKQKLIDGLADALFEAVENNKDLITELKKI